MEMNGHYDPPRPGVSPLKFFLLTFLLSWLIWIPLDLSHFGIGPFSIPETTSTFVRLLGVLMPVTAGIILTGRSGGRAAIRALLARLAIRLGASGAEVAGLILLTGWARNSEDLLLWQVQ